MAVSSTFLAFVLEQLTTVRDVSSRRLFGGVGIYSGDEFFAIVDDDTLFFKVDDASRATYREAGMPPFRPMKDKPPMEGYYQVPVAVLEDADALAAWAAVAIAVAARARIKFTGQRRGPAGRPRRT